MLAAILRGDSQGELALIEGRTGNWTRQLKARFERTLPDVAGRIRWLPAQPNEDFLHLLATADVMLDPPHFGGGNTSYEAFAVGTPVVTLPGPYLRSRITAALYAKMGADVSQQFVAETADDYVRKSLQLGREENYRQQARQQLRSASNVLFDDPAETNDFAAVLRSISP